MQGRGGRLEYQVPSTQYQVEKHISVPSGLGFALAGYWVLCTGYCLIELFLRQSHKRPTCVAFQGYDHTLPDNSEFVTTAGVGLLQTDCAAV